jgi:hypothetical protein
MALTAELERQHHISFRQWLSKNELVHTPWKVPFALVDMQLVNLVVISFVSLLTVFGVIEMFR